MLLSSLRNTSIDRPPYSPFGRTGWVLSECPDRSRYPSKPVVELSSGERRFFDTLLSLLSNLYRWSSFFAEGLISSKPRADKRLVVPHPGLFLRMKRCRLFEFRDASEFSRPLPFDYVVLCPLAACPAPIDADGNHVAPLV